MDTNTHNMSYIRINPHNFTSRDGCVGIGLGSKECLIEIGNKLGIYAEDKVTPNDSLIGKRIEVFWPEPGKWFPGLVIKTTETDKEGSHEVLYDDDPSDTILEQLMDSSTKWKFEKDE